MAYSLAVVCLFILGCLAFLAGRRLGWMVMLLVMLLWVMFMLELRLDGSGVAQPRFKVLLRRYMVE